MAGDKASEQQEETISEESVFSVDGQQIASGSYDNTIKV